MRSRYLAPILCVLWGCYESVPIQLNAVQPGTKIRVTLTDAGTDSLARYLGPGVQTVDGKLISTDESKLSLGVTSISMRSGQDQYWKGETVAIPRTALATVQQRKVNKPKSLLLGGVLIAALASLRLSGVVGGNSGGSGSGGHGGPQ
ncbi:MAG: hypothetical protein ACM34L_11250 [Gemmatimonas sp.]